MASVTTFIEPGTDATQDFSFYSSVSTSGTGSITSATDKPEIGPRSIKCTQGVGVGQSFVSTPASILADSGAQVSLWLYFDTLPSADAVFCRFRSGSASVLDFQIKTTGKLRNAPVGATGVDSTATLSVNTWYWIVISYYITNTTTYTVKVYIHDSTGSLLDTVTANAGTLTNTGTSLIRAGNVTTWANSSNVWLDSIYVATGGASSGSQPDFSGPIRCTAKRPNANGTTNGFTTQIGSGGSGYGSGHSPQVNEQPLSTTNGWSIAAVGSAITEEYNIEGAATGDVDISGATIVDYVGWVYTKALNAETGQIIVNNVTSNISITTSAAMFTKAAGSTTYPAGTGTDIGEVTDTTVTTVSLYECGIVFAYSPAAAATVRLLALTGVGN